jgi:hypothetical protein
VGSIIPEIRFENQEIPGVSRSWTNFFAASERLPVRSVNHSYRTHPIFFRELHDYKLSGPNFFGDRRQRHDRDTKTDLDRTLDGFDIVELRNLFYLDGMGFENLCRSLCESVCRARTGPCRVRSSRVRGPVSFLRTGARGTDQHETIRRHLSHGQAALCFGECQDTELDRSVENISNDARRAGIFEIDLRCRKFRHEFTNLRLELMQAYAVDGRDLHSSADLADESSKDSPAVGRMR